MAGTTGLEPAASAVTGQRSNQLNYVPAERDELSQYSRSLRGTRAGRSCPNVNVESPDLQQL